MNDGEIVLIETPDVCNMAVGDYGNKTASKDSRRSVRLQPFLSSESLH
jgi:hypothetical protein